MKPIRKGAIIPILLALALGSAAETLSPGLSVEGLGDGAFLVTHAYPWPANSLVVAMRDGRLLMVDTPYTPEATGEVLRWAFSKLGRREVVAITTHFHVDRLGGNAELVRRGIPIYGSTLTIKAIEERGAPSLEALAEMAGDPAIKAYFKSFRYVAPTRLFDPKDGLDLDFGGEEVKVEFPGPGHSIDNLVVYFPERRLLFGGCMILSAEAKAAGNVADGDIAEWIGSLAQVETDGYDIVVPGHGRPGGPGLVACTGVALRDALIGAAEHGRVLGGQADWIIPPAVSP